MDTGQPTNQNPHGGAIKSLRAECVPPMRQGELALRLGMKQNTLSAIERGVRRCPCAFARRVASVIATRSPHTHEAAALRIVMGVGA